jgi:hypothetical protein
MFPVTRGRQFVIVALQLDHPIEPSAACVRSSGPPFRACYERQVLRDPRLGQLIAQIRETAGRIRH